ncbi:MAG: DUF11 domain-containing protein [Proteobacteria bacterium]|nr:DUF11 domain-containing protein [Pseudomonadota bacterium]
MFAKVSKSMLLVAGALAVAAPAMAAAAEPVSLKSDLKLDKLVEENGVKRHMLVVPTKVVPGDHLVFTTSYTNNSGQPFNNFVLTNPLPKEVVLSDDGFGSFDCSVDGGKTWGKLASLSLDDGKGGKRPAQAGDVTHIRWALPAIAPGGTGTLEYHAVVR